MKKIFIVLLLISIGFLGCEKDDICSADTPTTPQLIIEFFDNANTLSKAVNKLTVKQVGNDKFLSFNQAKIKIPLKTDLDKVTYEFKLNTGETNGTENADILEFNYSRNSVYISRACGFKTNYQLNTTKTILIPEIPASPSTEWIKIITIAKPNILNENETHIKIFF